MAEWFKAAVLKTVVGLPPHRGFESLSLRSAAGLELLQQERGDAVASTWEGAGVWLIGSAC
jgi:hypothetical protein